MMLEKRPGSTAPDELIFRSCYAPADLRQLLAHPEAARRIRSLPAVQIFFGLQELDDNETLALLGHLEGEQWRQILDLALWKRDRADLDRFLGWMSYLHEAPPDVARRLVEAPDPELFELVFNRHLRIYSRIAEDEFEEMPQVTSEWFETPDNDYRIILPSDPERARLLRHLLTDLYRANPDRVRLYLESSRARTAMEIEEMAYEESKRRMEEQGFQDYFEAVEVYSPLVVGDPLREKKPDRLAPPMTLPALIPVSAASPWILVRALSSLAGTEDLPRVMEEIFFVCNKLLSADGISAADPRRVRQGIRKAISGINLGLDCWARSDTGHAAEGLRRYHLQSFFQIACGELRKLSHRWNRAHAAVDIEPGSFKEAVKVGLNRLFPLLTVMIRGKIRRRFFFRRRDIEILLPGS